MRTVRELPCCCCAAWVRVMPFVTCYGVTDPTEAICRTCLSHVDAERRLMLRDLRLDLRFAPDSFGLFLQVWRTVKSQAIERRARKAAA